MKVSMTKTEQLELKRIHRFLLNHCLFIDSLRYNCGIQEKEKEEEIREIAKKYDEFLHIISNLHHDNKNLIIEQNVKKVNPQEITQ